MPTPDACCAPATDGSLAPGGVVVKADFAIPAINLQQSMVLDVQSSNSLSLVVRTPGPCAWRV